MIYINAEGTIVFLNENTYIKLEDKSIYIYNFQPVKFWDHNKIEFNFQTKKEAKKSYEKILEALRNKSSLTEITL